LAAVSLPLMGARSSAQKRQEARCISVRLFFSSRI
jgi:hypothetical protein